LCGGVGDCAGWFTMQGGKGSSLIHREAGLQRQSNKERMSEWW
jgi:hypothetical protein